MYSTRQNNAVVYANVIKQLEETGGETDDEKMVELKHFNKFYNVLGEFSI